jgi:glutathione-regulated potassium-efflux system ancillary protein KefC
MDPIWLSIAFAAGLIVKLVGLPPLVGYLIAGFALNYYGAEGSEFLNIISELGILLLLFTIGLKLKIRDLIKPEIIIGGTIHMALTTGIFGIILFALSFTGIHFLTDIDLIQTILIAFALSFSSTVFAVKVFEDYGEVNSYHGILAIGVLIIQDIFAVIFLATAGGQLPNIYIFALPVALIILKPILVFILKKIGHGELLILFGFFAALVLGGELFKFVGLKADLGALIIGMLLANTKQTDEMAEKLLAFKDFFLIGFFLSIGMTGVPHLNHLIVALILLAILIIKVILYFFIFTRFKIRARTALFSTLALSNYSEFGLIILLIAVSVGWIGEDWLVILAIALSISYFISAPINERAHKIFGFLKRAIKKIETRDRLEYDRTFDIGSAEILIFGMGRVGTAVYDQLKRKYGQKVLALDYDLSRVKKHQSEGRNVTHDDATDIEFWEVIKDNKQQTKQVKMVLLCMGNFKSNLIAINRLKYINFDGNVAAVAKHEDEIDHLKKLGVDSAYNLYSEAGVGFADHVCINLDNTCGKDL